MRFEPSAYLTPVDALITSLGQGPTCSEQSTEVRCSCYCQYEAPAWGLGGQVEGSLRLSSDLRPSLDLSTRQMRSTGAVVALVRDPLP